MGSDDRVRIPCFLKGKHRVHYYEKLGETVKIKAGILIAYPGKLSQYCYYIRRGRVFAGVTDNAMGERFLFSFEEGCMFLEQYLLTGTRSTMFFVADTDITAQQISYPELIQAMKSRFFVTLDIIQAITGFGETALARAVWNLEENAAVRVCNLLIDMSELFGEKTDKGILLTVRIKQDILGKLTGLHRITVIREIKKLKALGLLTVYEGSYCILDMEKLREYRDEKMMQ